MLIITVFFIFLTLGALSQRGFVCVCVCVSVCVLARWVSAFTSGNFRILLAIEPRLHASPHVRPSVEKESASLHAVGQLLAEANTPSSLASLACRCISFIFTVNNIWPSFHHAMLSKTME